MPGSNTDAYAIQHWVDVSNAQGGVVLSSLEAPVMKFGRLWPGAVSQAHHGMQPLGFGAAFLRDPAGFVTSHVFSYIMCSNFRTNFRPVQPGESLFRYSLTTHSGALDRAGANHFGLDSARPLQTMLIRSPQGGTLPVSDSLCRVEPAGVELMALKQADDGQGIIVRFREIAGQNHVATLTLPGFEISDARLTNLVEENEDKLEHTPHAIRVPLKANGFATVRLRLRGE